MIYGMLSRLARVRFTVGYVTSLAAVSIAILMLGPHAHELVIQRASTNLHNLAHGRLGTLLDSAFVVDAGPLYFWLPCLACLLAVAELQLHSIRLTVAFLVGHVGSTLLVAAALAAAIELGWLPMSLTRASDVGMSYGALAVIGALTAAIPRRWQPAWIGWWVSAGIATAVIGAGFTDAGHTVAVILGVLVATRFRRAVHWTLLRYLLLAVAWGFGFLMLAHTWWTMAAGLAFGALGALAAYAIAQLSAVRSSPPEATLTGPQPVMTV
jgi:hypothetical protein